MKKSSETSGVARYQQLYTVLSQALGDGTLRDGDPLPSEPALVREYGVSRTTVRRALALLAADGHIVRRRGRGTFASGSVPVRASRRASRALDRADPRLDRLLLHKMMPTPQFVADEFPDFGASVLLLRRLRGDNPSPVSLETIWIPGVLAPLLPRDRVARESALALLERQGHRPALAEREQSAVPADPTAARYLRVPVGAPLLEIRQLVRTAEGAALELSRCLYRPDRYESHTRIERDARDAASGNGSRVS